MRLCINTPCKSSVLVSYRSPCYFMAVTIHEAVRALRQHAEKTQQVFSTELGMSISSLVNYERDRVPEPKQLLVFARAAAAAGRNDLGAVFKKAAEEALGHWLLSKLPSESWYEIACLEALERCLSGGTDFQKITPAVISALAPVIEQKAREDGNPDLIQRFAEESVRRGFVHQFGKQRGFQRGFQKQNKRSKKK